MNHNSMKQNISEIESHWCSRMTSLVEENQIEDADALYSEFVVDEIDPTDSEWMFIQFKYVY